MAPKLGTVKHAYWSALGALQRRLRPQDKVLSPHAWMDAIHRFVPRDQDRVVYVDGGAHDGRMAKRFAKAFDHLEAHAFEPNADLFPRLDANLAGIPGRRIHAALGNAPGETTLHVNASAMTSSILPRSEHGKRYFGAATRLRETRTVTVTALDEWFTEPIDILKLDLQGYEAEALRGARRLLDRGVRCIFTEVNFVPLYEGSALFGDVDRILREHGYHLFNLYNLATKTKDWQLNGGDALYVPDESVPAIPIRRAA